MVSIDKIESGIAAYLDAEIMPHLQKNGAEKVLIGTMASLLIRRSGAIVDEYKNNKLVKMLGIMDDDGNIDVDTLVSEVKNNIAANGFVLNIPVIGTFTFHAEDIDKLYNFIMEA